MAALALNSCDALVLGQGVAAGLCSVIMVVVLLAMGLFGWLRRRPEALRRFLLALAWALIGITAVAAHVVDIRGAGRRFQSVIAACRAYQQQHGQLPDSLEQLVPELLPQVPPARRLGLGRGFQYLKHDGRHTLMYVVFPPFYRRFFDFEQNRESTLD
jgi:predicted membrane metal-binding protein